jgi:hypothetical protein
MASESRSRESGLAMAFVALARFGRRENSVAIPAGNAHNPADPADAGRARMRRPVRRGVTAAITAG